MDPRLPRAIAAMAALVRADMANPVNPEAPTKTVSEVTRQAMAVATQLTRGPGGGGSRPLGVPVYVTRRLSHPPAEPAPAGLPRGSRAPSW